jgi:membrane-associated phospholipid phosphatase
VIPPAVVISSLILEYPLFLAGYFAAGKTDDKLLVKRVIGLFAVLLAAYLSLELLKNFFDRPRYRTVVLGYEGVGFEPWYKPFAGADTYMAEYGLPSSEFRSFPSGHSLFSNLTMCILPSLAWVFPKLKDKQLHLFLGGLVFSLIIMFTRMILGAHYLSDVSAGAMIGTLCAILFSALQLRISSGSKN